MSASVASATANSKTSKHNLSSNSSSSSQSNSQNNSLNYDIKMSHTNHNIPSTASYLYTNGNATTSSAGSTSSYETTNGNYHETNGYGTINSTSHQINGLNSKMSNLSMASINSTNTNFMMSILLNNVDDSAFSDLGKDELNILMNEAISHMDLPPDKLKIVKMLPDEKKIQVLRSLRFVNEKQPPDYYIQALKTYIDVINNQKSHRRPKTSMPETSTELIKNLEVSLRTNRIDWVHKFLDPPLNGLDVLIEYLESTLNFMRECERFNMDTLSENLNGNYSNGQTMNTLNSYSSTALTNRINTNGTSNRTLLNGLLNGNTASTSTLTRAPSSLSSIASLERRHSRLQKDTRKRMNRLKIGEAADDIHECVRCLRAIMNHQVLFFVFVLFF